MELQVWRGACLLSEFILHKKSLFENKTVVELGSGVGLAGMALGGTASTVYLTDNNTQALELARGNIGGIDAGGTTYKYRDLDWCMPPEFLEPREASRTVRQWRD